MNYLLNFTPLDDLIHSLASKSDTVLEFELCIFYSRVFYDTLAKVNEYMPQNKWQAEIGDISEYEWKSYFLSTYKWHEV